MARQSNYNTDRDITGLDRFTGINASDGSTANFTVEDLAAFFAQTGAADPSRLGFQFDYAGEYSANSTIASGQYRIQLAQGGTGYAHVTAIAVSNTSSSGSSFVPQRQLLTDSVIKITSIEDSGDVSYANYQVIGHDDISSTSATLIGLRHIASAGSLPSGVVSVAVVSSHSGVVQIQGTGVFAGTIAPEGVQTANAGSYYFHEILNDDGSVNRLDVYGPKTSGTDELPTNTGWGEPHTLTGSDGDDLTVTSSSFDANGNTIVVFSDGSNITIQRGPQGETGLDGDDGESVTGATGITNSDNSVTVTFSTPSDPNIGQVTIPQGGQGDQGPQGVGVVNVNQVDANTVNFTLTEGGPTSNITLPRGDTGDTGNEGPGVRSPRIDGDNLLITPTINGVDQAETTVGDVRGPQGPQGEPGPYVLRMYQALPSSSSAPAKPTDGSVNIAEAVFTVDASDTAWVDSTSHGSDETLWVSQVSINPLSTTDTIKVLSASDWSEPFTAGTQGPTGNAGDDGIHGTSLDATFDGTNLTVTETSYDSNNVAQSPVTVVDNVQIVGSNVTATLDTSDNSIDVFQDGTLVGTLNQGVSGDDGLDVRVTLNSDGSITVEQERPDGSYSDIGTITNGDDGPQGPQGEFSVSIFIASSSQPNTPSAQTGTNGYNLHMGVFTPPTGWSSTPVSISDGEILYESRAFINPATDDDDNNGFSDLNWTTPFEAGEAGPTGMPGMDGASAFDIFVAQTGNPDGLTEAEWLASLAGEDGNGVVSILRTAGDGSEGTEDIYTITYTDGNTDTITVQNGSQGQSAYDVYVGTVPEGETPLTLTEWLISLRGANGIDGVNGIEGAQGLSRIELYSSVDPGMNPPTGVVLNTADFTFNMPPTPWDATFTSGDYVSFALVNPALFVAATYDVPDPSWSTPVLATALGPAGPSGPPGVDGADGIDANVNALTDGDLPTVAFVNPIPADLSSLAQASLVVNEDTSFALDEISLQREVSPGSFGFVTSGAWSQLARLAIHPSSTDTIFDSGANNEFLVYSDTNNWAVFLATANPDGNNRMLVQLVEGEFSGDIQTGTVTIFRDPGTRFFSENYGKILIDSNVSTDGRRVTVDGELFIGADPVLTDNGVDANVSAVSFTALTSILVDETVYNIPGTTPPSGGGTGTGLSLFTDVLTTVPVTADFNTMNMEDRGEAHHSQSVSFNYDEGGPETQYALLAVPTNLLGTLEKPVIHLSGVFQLDPDSITAVTAATSGYSGFYFDLAEDINVQIDL